MREGRLKGQKNKEQRKGFSDVQVGLTFKLHRSSHCFHLTPPQFNTLLLWIHHNKRRNLLGSTQMSGGFSPGRENVPESCRIPGLGAEG